MESEATFRAVMSKNNMNSTQRYGDMEAGKAVVWSRWSICSIIWFAVGASTGRVLPDGNE